MSKFDIYESVERLVAEMCFAGYVSEANALRDAIAEGATGTEILMAIAFHLRSFSDKNAISEKLKIQTKEIIFHVDLALE
jgi:hypothetical protein